MTQDGDFKVTKEDLDLFLSEALEFLANTEENLVELEKNPSDSGLVQEIFRAMHTIKGGAATLGFQTCVQVTHTMESILDEVRSGSEEVTKDLIDMLFVTLDWLKAWAEAVSKGSTSPPHEKVLSQAEKFRAQKGPKTPHGSGGSNGSHGPDNSSAHNDVTAKPQDRGSSERPDLVLTVKFSSDAPLLSVRCFQVLTLLDEVTDVLDSSPSLEEIENDKARDVLQVYLRKEADRQGILKVVNSVQDVKEAVFQDLSDVVALERAEAKASGIQKQNALYEASQKASKGSAPEVSARKTQLGKTVRVDVGLLDFLLNMVGELVIDRTRLSQIASRLLKTKENLSIGNEIGVLASHLQRTSQELQEGIMRARLLPLKNIFIKFPRMIRDLSDKCGKKVEFTIEGEDTELDRTVLEAVDDPLIHVLRNAIDHGIETPSERMAKGKPEVGKIALKAWHEENQVLIRVEDDGAGIDTEKLKKSCLKKGLLTEEQLSKLSEKEVLELIFMPGFSTTDKPTEVSGRGVGMDVVRSNLERINGQVEVRTWPSKGTWVTLRLPLTLAIMRALLVESSGLIYAIPTFSVEEVVALKTQDRRSVHGKPAMTVRNRVFPLFSLSEALWNGSKTAEPKEKFALLTRAGDSAVALGVDDLLGEEEIVVKEMGRVLSRLKGIAGATILAQGDPALILDVNRLL